MAPVADPNRTGIRRRVNTALRGRRVNARSSSRLRRRRARSRCCRGRSRSCARPTCSASATPRNGRTWSAANQSGSPCPAASNGFKVRKQAPASDAAAPRPNPRTATGPPQTLLVFRGCGRLHRRQRGACVGAGPSVRRRPIGDRAAPASVRSSSDGLTAPIHATERSARVRPMGRRAAASGGARVSGEPARTLARDDREEPLARVV